MLYDIDTNDDGAAYHQHVDHVFFAHASERTLSPGPGEEPADAWEWYTPEELRAASIDPDTVAIGIEAVETVREWS